MHYYEVAPSKIVRQGSSFFTYSSEQPLERGQIVTIPIGKQSLVGIVLSKVNKPSFQTKHISSVVETKPLPMPLLNSLLWLSGYYHSPLAQVLSTCLPAGITKTRRDRHRQSVQAYRERTTFVLNKDQSAVLSKISKGEPNILLHGITGSGKTTVYLEAAKQMITKSKSVIVIVPEIALTTQLVAEFSNYFDDILLTHSHQTEAERHRVWREALTATKPTVAIGPRSALFSPLTDVGLIIIDECHEPSLKQEKSPRYSALELAKKLASEHHGTTLFGSATPLIADYYESEKSPESIAVLLRLARENANPPSVKLIDMTKRDLFTRHRFLSDELLTSIDNSLKSGKQALIFHNRRGSALVSLCTNCGWQAGCPHCFIPLTLHADRHKLVCHICDYQAKVPTSCPTCHSTDITHKGIGTKLIETELTRLYPNKKVIRFDSDNHHTESLDSRYQELYDNQVDIIIGTQMVAKGLDLPHLSTLGIVQADTGLSLPDFSASERTFQLITQAIGRVGRSHEATTAIVQTYQPNHPSIKFGVQQDYQGFYKYALEVRRRSNFPPFCHLLKLANSYKTEAAASRNAKTLAGILRSSKLEIEVVGPTPAFRERIGDTYRWQLVVKSSDRDELLKAIDLVPPSGWQYELDPLNLL